MTWDEVIKTDWYKQQSDKSKARQEYINDIVIPYAKENKLDLKQEISSFHSYADKVEGKSLSKKIVNAVDTPTTQKVLRTIGQVTKPIRDVLYPEEKEGTWGRAIEENLPNVLSGLKEQVVATNPLLSLLTKGVEGFENYFNQPSDQEKWDALLQNKNADTFKQFGEGYKAEALKAPPIDPVIDIPLAIATGGTGVGIRHGLKSGAKAVAKDMASGLSGGLTDVAEIAGKSALRKISQKGVPGLKNLVGDDIINLPEEDIIDIVSGSGKNDAEVMASNLDDVAESSAKSNELFTKKNTNTSLEKLGRVKEEYYRDLEKTMSPEQIKSIPKKERDMEILKRMSEELPTKPSGVAKSIEAKAVENGLIEKGYAELAEYNPSTLKEQSEIVSNMMKNDFERVKRIAVGDEPLPTGMRPATPLSAMEDFAMANKDGELAKRLAESPLNSQISQSASEVSLARIRSKDSASAKIKEIMTEREKIVEKRMKGIKPDKIKADLRKSLDNTIAKTKPNKYSWAKFLEEIKC